MKEYQKIITAVLVALALYYVSCKCMEMYSPYDPYFSGKTIQEKPSSILKPGGTTDNSEKVDSGNGCGQDAMFISSNLLPKTEQTEDNYFEGLNVPVDASNVELPLERQFYSTGSCRNANLNLRSEPPNPMKAVSPWNISTITNCDGELRRPLEIGGSEQA